MAEKISLQDLKYVRIINDQFDHLDIDIAHRAGVWLKRLLDDTFSGEYVDSSEFSMLRHFILDNLSEENSQDAEILSIENRPNNKGKA